MKRCSSPLTLALLCLLSASVGAQTVIHDAVEDSWLHGLSSSSTSGGSSNRLSICPTADYWIYLKFDLSTVAGRGVADAELRVTRFGGRRPEEISLYFIPDDAWSEATLAGTTRPDPKAPDPATKLAIGQEVEGFDRWSGPSLNEVVQEAANGDGLLTLMIREDPNNQLDVRSYYSREGAPGPDETPKLVVTLAAEESVATGWKTVDVGTGVKPAFDFGPGGRVHVTGMTEETDGLVWYATAPGVEGPWSPRTIVRGYFYGPGDLRVDPEGVAHIAWHNHDQEDPNHATVDPQGEARVFSIPSPGHNGWDNSLAIDAMGQLHQTSVNPSGFGAATSLEYGFFDGMRWSYAEVPESGSFMYGLATSLAIDRTGQPHVAYCHAADWTAPGELRYAVRDADTWSISTVVGDGPVGRFPALALDHWDRPHIVWLDVDPGDSTRAFVRYGVLNAGEWEIEEVDVLERVDLSFGGARKSVSIALDSESRPHIAYGDQRVVRYAVKPFGEWKITSVLEHADEMYKGLVVLRLDANGSPALTFWETQGVEGRVRLAFAAGDNRGGRQRPGDCTQDGQLNIADAVCLLSHLFVGSPSELPCGRSDSAGNASLLDSNGDGGADLSDAVTILSFLFFAGAPPALGTECVPLVGCPEVCGG